MEDQIPVTARVVLELVGGPKEHIENTLNEMIEKIKKEPGITLVEFHKEEAKETEVEKGIKGIFSAFAEVEIRTEDPHRLLTFCLDYTPSSLEILEPQSLKLSSRLYSSIMNDMLANIHKFSTYIVNINAEYKVLKKELEKIKGSESSS